MAETPESGTLTERLTRPLDAAARNVRAATTVARARPAYAAGLRAALATFVPLLAAQVFRLGGGTWMSLAGFSGALADKGGSYGARAAAVASLTVFGAFAVLIGGIGTDQLAVAVALTFVVAVVCSLGRAWGNTGASVGGSVLNMFVISLAYPTSGIAEALGRAGWTMVGGGWAALLSLVLWPVRPYRPARIAIAACFRSLADHVAQVVDAFASPTTADDAAPAGSLVVRTALENARATLATIRRGRPGESGRGERLLVLRETADQIFGNVIALVETIEAVPSASRDRRAQAMIVAALREVVEVLRELADHVEEERQSGVVLVHFSGAPLLASLTMSDARAGEAAATDDAGFAAAQYAHAAALIDRIAMFASVAAANAAALGGLPVPPPPTVPETEELREPRALLAPLRSVLARDSLVLRHALRVGLVTAAAVALAGAFGLSRGYWVTVTVVIILQPYMGATTLKAVQRVLGTVVGGILTAALGALFQDLRAILVFSFVFAAVSVAVLPLNYTAYSVFLTPTFVLLAEANAGDWHLAGVRVIDTLLGGALALLGARLLWPAPEWKRLPTYLAAALRANRDYLRTAVATFADRSDAAGRLLRARRRDAALAAINAEESFQRLMGEHKGSPAALAPVMTFLTYARRFAVSVAALAVARHTVDPATTTMLEQFADAVTRRLDAMANRLDARSAAMQAVPVGQVTSAEGDVPAPDHRVAIPDVHDPILRARLTRLQRQLDTLLTAAEDILARGPVTGRASRAGGSAPHGSA